MLRAVVLAIVASSISRASAAEPAAITYLECVTNQEGTPVWWHITLNEQAGVVTYNSPVGWQRRSAQFTPDAVYFIGFKLSRVNLTMVRQYENMVGTEVRTERGQCHIADQPKRAYKEGKLAHPTGLPSRFAPGRLCCASTPNKVEPA